MKIKDISLENRPRERFELQGPESLSDAELFALFLDNGVKNVNVVDVANSLLSTYGIHKLMNCSLKELQKIKGIGKVKAIKVLALFELMKRYSIKKPKIKISSASDVYDYLSPRLSTLEKEYFFVIHLNTANKVLKTETISIGTIGMSLVHPREVFRSAIKENVHRIILVHNHPSGEIAPSEEDKDITQLLKESGDLVGISVLDHIIIGKEGYFSFADNSLI